MRILFLSNLYPPHELGGMEQLCEEAVLGLRSRGHETHVLCSRYGVAADEPAEPGVERVLYLEADIAHYRPAAFFLQRPAQERANRKALRRAIDAYRPDVIFIWGMWNLSTDLAYWAEQWLPGRVAYAIAGYWFLPPNAHEAYWSQPARRPLTRALLALPRRIALRQLARERAARAPRLEQAACVSHYVRDKLMDGGVLPATSRVIYNGIDPAPYESLQRERPIDSGRLRLIYTGGVVQHKGVHTAVEALGLLKQWGLIDRVTLTILGGGHPDYVASLQARIAELGLQNAIALPGRVPREQVPAALAEHDVFPFTSLWEEPIARTVMEAMAAGLAVIATPVGGQAEMLEDGVNALTYPAGDSVALADRIRRLLGDPVLLRRLAVVGRQTVLERFTLKRMVDEYEAWLKEIVP